MKDLNLFRCKDSAYLREVSSKEEALEDLDCDGFLVRSNERVCRSIITSLRDRCKEKDVRCKDYKIGFVGGDDVLNRRVVETLDIDYLVSPEGARGEGRGARKDTLKQRDSGLNHVVAKLAREKGVGIVVDLGEVSGLDDKEKAERIARVMQNVRVCRKAGCEVRVASLGRGKGEVFSEKARRAFGAVVGMSSGEVRDCVRFGSVENLIPRQL